MELIDFVPVLQVSDTRQSVPTMSESDNLALQLKSHMDTSIR